MCNRLCVVCNTEISDKRILNSSNSKYCSNKCIKVAWRLSNKESDLLSKRKHQMGKRYGISWEDFLQQHENQNGCCAICNIPIPIFDTKCRAYIDHNHTTNKVRDLLCQHCNSLIGFAKESPVLLRLAAEYLDRHDEDVLIILKEDK